MTKTIKAGAVTLDSARYQLMTLNELATDVRDQWVADTDLKGKATIVPFRDPCFEPGITVQVLIEGRYYYRKLESIDLQENK